MPYPDDDDDDDCGTIIDALVPALTPFIDPLDPLDPLDPGPALVPLGGSVGYWYLA